MVKQKTNKMLAVMLVLAVMLTSLIAGAMLLAPKTSEVNAYEPGSSATLSRDWTTKLANPVTETCISNLTITTTASKIVGFTDSGIDISEEQNGSLHYYFKNAGYEVDAYWDGMRDAYDVVMYADVETIYAPANCSDLFPYFGNCKTITFDNFVITSNVTDMREMFSGGDLSSIDFSKWDTSNVTDMSGMFQNCSSLTSLDLSGWDTSKVTDMSYMFANGDLSSIDLSGWDTSNVTDMGDMFSGCSSLTSLDVSNFNTSNVTSMSGMFSGCSSLTSLDLSGWDTSKVTDMSYMFANGDLSSIDLSGWDTSNVTDMGDMFSGCSSLTSLDVSNFNTSNVTSMSGMFSGCSSLTSLDLSGWDTSKVTNMYEMFSNTGISHLNLSYFDISSVTNSSHIFANHCFVQLDLPNKIGNTEMYLEIEGPYSGPALYVNGTGDPVTTITSEHEGAILTRQGVEPILPPDVGEIDPDTPESGVTLVDLLILTMLTLTLSGVCVIILKNKNKSLIKK